MDDDLYVVIFDNTTLGNPRAASFAGETWSAGRPTEHPSCEGTDGGKAAGRL